MSIPSNRTNRAWAPGSALLLAAALLLLAAPLLPGAGLSAQQTGSITGRVTAAESGQPLSAAMIEVGGTKLGILTREDGRFLIPSVPAGSHDLEVTMIGYRGVTRTVDVPAGGAATVDLALQLQPVQLGGVQVSVLRPDMQPQSELSNRQVEAAHPKDSGELLRNVTGVGGARRGPVGVDPVIRGLRETEIGTYVDGTRWFTAGPARMDSPLTHLDPSAIKSIQVVKGPYALTWGAGNQSAIRVETQSLLPRGSQDPTGSVDAGYDSNTGATQTFGNVGGRSGPVSFWAQGAWRKGSDYTDGVGNVIPGKFGSWEGRGKIGFDVGANSLLSLSGGYQKMDSIDYPGRLLNAAYFHERNLALELKTQRDAGLLRTFDAQVYNNWVNHKMGNWGKPTALHMDGRMPPFALDIGVQAHSDVWGGKAYTDLRTGPWQVRLGGDVYSLNRNAVRTIKNAEKGMTMFTDLMWPDATITDGGVYGQLERGLGSTVHWTGTVRLDRVDASADTASDFFLENVSTKLKSSETNLSASTTLGVQLDASWNLSLGLGSAVRTADATERYSDRIPSSKAQMTAEFMGNPALQPERSNQADVWLNGVFTDFAVKLNLFGRKVSNYITLTPTDLPKELPLSPPTVFQYVNGDATFWGSELSATLGLTETLTADVSGSYLWGRDDTIDEPAIGIEPLTGDLGLRYQEPGGRYFVEGTLHVAANQNRVATTRGEVPTPGYGVTNLRTGWAPAPGMNLRLGVNNLFNKEYVDHLNAKDPFAMMTGAPVRIPEPGRVIFLDASYGF